MRRITKKGDKPQAEADSKKGPCWEAAAENICGHISISTRNEGPCHKGILKRLNYLSYLVEGHVQCALNQPLITL